VRRRGRDGAGWVGGRRKEDVHLRASRRPPRPVPLFAKKGVENGAFDGLGSAKAGKSLGESVGSGTAFATTVSRPMAGKRIGHTFTKHGVDNTERLLKEAAGSGRSVGQWLDDGAAEQFIADHLSELTQGARTFDLPEGLGCVVNPEGTFTPATKVRLVPSKSGVKTA